MLTPSPSVESVIVVCGPTRQSSPICVAPFRLVPGSITVSWPIVTSTSM